MSVNPKNTSQNCSGCGKKVRKKLSDRVHDCSHCGLKMDRDENAARNIKNIAVNINKLAEGHPVGSKAQSRTEAQAGAAEKPRGCRLGSPQTFIRPVHLNSIGN